jgi:hypothetical protein
MSGIEPNKLSTSRRSTQREIKITSEERDIVQRLKRVRGPLRQGLDWWTFVYGFFVGAGLTPSRAKKFTLLTCYHEWLNDPVFGVVRNEGSRPR